MAIPAPLPQAPPTVAIAFLLHPEQIAWICSHASRNASLFMRRLQAQLMKEECCEVQSSQSAHRTEQPWPAVVAPSGQHHGSDLTHRPVP
jgi:hypothetical protein